jgi:putative redox protein
MTDSAASTSSSTHRSLSVERGDTGQFFAVNARGGRLAVGRGEDEDFTPTELLLAAIGSCTAIDVDILTSRRARPDSFAVTVDAEKVRDAEGNRLTDISVTFAVLFPPGEGGDAARDLLPDAAQRSHDRLCTVGRTVEVGTPIATVVLPPPPKD